MEIRMACESGKYRCTLSDNGHTIAVTQGDSLADARQWMRQQLTRIYVQGCALLTDPDVVTELDDRSVPG